MSETSSSITSQEVPWVTHPIYDLYQANCDGYTQHARLKKTYRGSFNRNGDQTVRVRPILSLKTPNVVSYSCIQSHRFVWECFNGEIPEGMQVVHKDGNKVNNSLGNLKLEKQRRDSSYVKNNHYKNYKITATDIETGEKTVFYSLYQIQKVFGINSKSVHKAYKDKKPMRGYNFEFAVD